jgi:hypothetical protein
MPITITLTPDEQRAFLQLIDAALRYSGTGALSVATHFQAKLAAAGRQAVTAETGAE